MSKADATSLLNQMQSQKVILLEGPRVAGKIDLDGWDPDAGAKKAGCVAGVVIRYWASGTKKGAPASGGNAPDILDPRNAVALVRLCQWLKSTYGVTELYHLGAGGGGVDKDGNPRTDCHGQGRAIDFVGAKGTNPSTGADFLLTVYDDWGHVSTPSTPGGAWPPGTGSKVHFRLDDQGSDPVARDFFKTLYAFVATQYQDRTDGTGDAGPPTSIGNRSFIMHPDHPATAPGTPHGREAHQGHMHMQIGVTGTEK
jgi:hypothetical protein